MGRNAIGERFTPVEFFGSDVGGEIVEVDIGLHQREHGLLVGDVDVVNSIIATPSQCQTNEADSCSQFHSSCRRILALPSSSSLVDQAYIHCLGG